MPDIEKYMSGQMSWFDASEAELLLGYQAMVDDGKAEEEALEWCEALIGDAFEPNTEAG